MDKFAQKYREEATEIIAKLEELILSVERHPDDLNIVNEIFRSMHTIKGGGAMFGFSKVSDVTHELESIFDYIRNGKAKITKELLDISLDIIDYVKLLIKPNSNVDEDEHKDKVEELNKLKEKFKNNSFKNGNGKEKKTLEKSTNQKEKKNTETPPKKEEIKSTKKRSKVVIENPLEIKENLESQINYGKTYKIFFKPHKDIQKNGTDPLLLLREISELGLAKIISITDNIPTLDKLNYDETYICWIIILVTERRNEIDDVFIFIEDESTIIIEEIFEGNAFDNENFVQNIDAIFAREIEKHTEECPEIEPSVKKEKKYNAENKQNKEEYNELIKNIYTDGDENSEQNDDLLEKSKKAEKNLLKNTENNTNLIVDFNENSDEKIIENIEENKVADTYLIKSETVFENEIVEFENDTEAEVAQNIEETKNNEFLTSKLKKEKTTNVQTEESNTITSLRISAKNVDNLMNLVSELITTQARLGVFVENNENPELENITENIQKLSRQLRDIAFNFSMIPLNSVVIRFQRLVRDLSSKLNKKIEFKTEGTSTEIDKRIIENLIDPIMHLLRNCLDHGVEDKETRQKHNKPEVATVFLKAYYSGSNVFIQIGDDGHGINTEIIKEKAIEKGLLSANVDYKKDEILNVIFEPGFSTAKNVSDVSGRGVGLDVVKRKISELRGEIKIETELQYGTVFTIKLPLTLSIIDGLLVLIGNTRYVIPMGIVETIYAIRHSELEDSNFNLIILDNKQIPFLYLRDEFFEESESPEIEQVIVIKQEEKLYSIVVDKIVGEYQAVLKTLGQMYKEQQMFSGATILGDGTVALVMDVRKLIERFSQKK